jgi:hypothetical protein
MAKCDVVLEGPIPFTDGAGPGVTFRLSPSTFVPNNHCKLEITINGIRVTGTGDFGGEHVTGYASNGGISIQPLPKKTDVIVFAIDCPDCHSMITAYTTPAPPDRRRNPLVHLIISAIGGVIGGVIGGLSFGPIGAVGGATLGVYIAGGIAAIIY